MQALLDVILPVFLVIGAGYALAWRGYLSGDQFDALMKYAQGFAVPCLLFVSIARVDLAANFDMGLFLSFYMGAFSGFALGFFGAKHLFARPTADAVAIGFCCLFSNSLLLGLSLTERAYGRDALDANYAIVAIHAPLFYAFGISLMEIVRGHGSGLAAGVVAGKVVKATLSNALVIGILLGFAVNLAGNPLPGFAWSAVEMIARTGLPTALFGLGGILFRYRPEGDKATIGMVVAISLLAHPAITYGLGRGVFGLTVEQLRSAVVTAAMAPGINAYLFANMYGAARRVAASSVLVGTAASILTAWVWLAVLP
jgi:predicted permease